MNRDDFDNWNARIRDRATLMWETDGRPEGGSDRYVDQARELLAIEEVALPGLDPDDAAQPIIEEASIQGNLGEFPTLTDQGEEMTYPQADGPRLSDGDASEHGGVLPIEDYPDAELPEVSMADADVTSSGLNAEDDPPNDDLNDDGLPDPEAIDDDAEGEMAPGDEYEDGAPPR